MTPTSTQFLVTLVCLSYPHNSHITPLQLIVKKAAVMIEAHESLQKLNRLYFAYVHQSISVTTTTAGLTNIIDWSTLQFVCAAEIFYYNIFESHFLLLSDSSTWNSPDFHLPLFFHIIHKPLISILILFPLSSLLHEEGEMDAAFTRPLVLARLGQFIMEVKVSR